LRLPSAGATLERASDIVSAMEYDRTRMSASVLALAAMDSVIERGTLCDWIELRAAALVCPEVFADLRRLCRIRTADLYDPFADGHRAWLAYIDSAIGKDASCAVLRQAFIKRCIALSSSST
jgi:hypothetical protein